MPKIQQVFEIDITPEKFLRNCSRVELIELQLLLSSPHYQHQMEEPEAGDVSMIYLPTKQ
ncbi:hypothetical protein [uncultured Sunxiuqinia sp.]|uniref:hypothetical protein n=1 Tax=uncultured Sunxiuqinia sp. TaxID=1573825 RepID=UPI00260E553D|nr:hypothetical protein [uncultured Sunxiuqinia sp.]